MSIINTSVGFKQIISTFVYFSLYSSFATSAAYYGARCCTSCEGDYVLYVSTFNSQCLQAYIILKSTIINAILAPICVDALLHITTSTP